MIDVIGGAVPGVAEDDERSFARLAELLHAERSPLQHRRAAQRQRLQEMIGGLGRAGERAGKNLGVRDDATFPACNGLSRVIDKWFQRSDVEEATFREWFLVGDVAGVQSVEQEDAVDHIGLLPQDRPHGAVPGAERGEPDAADRRRDGGEAFAKQPVG
ncbi:MAG TPA: hypothetical protein VM779_09950 [Thermoanaerobaculia bacterium]|nr:hypothetical protein [Thermoanaerobaculia bacterium]